MTRDTTKAFALECNISGVGAWGPGFNNWQSLRSLFVANDNSQIEQAATSVPKPLVIPANERRRAPLPVKAAVEVSSQALTESGLSSGDVACVFGSGLGDTEITDYMCRALAGVEKQLSPTKFHNSVHNAAAGYWTISSGCMKSANSIAGYTHTAGLAMLEGVILCVLEQEPVLVTLFDIAAHETYRQIFPCQHSFAASILISPPTTNSATRLAKLRIETGPSCRLGAHFASDVLNQLYRENPAAQSLALLATLDKALALGQEQQAQLSISDQQDVLMHIQAPIND